MTLTWFLRPDRYEGRAPRPARGPRARLRQPPPHAHAGEVVDGHMHGKGTYWHADSSRYEGSFCKSQRHGYGEYFFADGSYYKGEYKGGAKDGYGVFVYRDETRYEGTFASNVKEGQGIMYYADGRARRAATRDARRRARAGGTRRALQVQVHRGLSQRHDGRPGRVHLAQRR